MNVIFLIFLSFLYLGIAFYLIYSETPLEKLFNEELEKGLRDRQNAERRKGQDNA